MVDCLVVLKLIISLFLAHAHAEEPKKIFDLDISMSTNCVASPLGIRCWGEGNTYPTGRSGVFTESYLGVSAGAEGGCAWTKNKIDCWGSAKFFETPPTVLEDIRELVVQGLFSSELCAIDGAKGLVCWGSSFLDYPKDLPNPRKIKKWQQEVCVQDDNGVGCWRPRYRGTFSYIPGWKDAIDFDLAPDHKCAILQSGKVDCVGFSGRGATDAPKDLINPKSIATGLDHTCALDDSGVRCWGFNGSGQASPPAFLPPGVLSLEAGSLHTCAVYADDVQCWGDDEKKQTSVPRGLEGVKTIAVGSETACATTKSGVECWGSSLGAVSRLSFRRTAEIIDISRFAICATDGLRLSPTECKGTTHSSPSIFDALDPIQIKLAPNFACLRERWGKVNCWGNNIYGQTDVPKDLRTARDLAVRNNVACALTEFEIICWGNGRGRIKIPVSYSALALTRVKMCALSSNEVHCYSGFSSGPQVALSNLRNPRNLVATDDEVCVLSDEGVRCSPNISRATLNIQRVTDAKTIFAGGTTACALSKKGVVSCFGNLSLEALPLPAF